MSIKTEVLMEVLQCKEADMVLLDRVNYDFEDIRAKLAGMSSSEVSLNGIMQAVVKVGIDNISLAVSDAICELEAITNERELDDDEELALSELNSLDPHSDIQSSHNYLDTHVWISAHAETYHLYLQEALDDFHANTGLAIT